MQGALLLRAAAVLPVLLAVVAPACKKSRSEAAVEEQPPEENGTGAAASGQGEAPVPPAQPPPGPTGTIAGKILLRGTPPEMPLLQRGADPFCASREMHAETVVVGAGGGLANALARVEPGAVKGWVPSGPVVVDQVDCMYRPRVQGGVRGQTLEVRNSDKTTHNVNARRIPWGERRDSETIFNRGQPAGSPPLTEAIRDSDILKLRCDAHGWMQGYVVVGDNPYFATSDADGRFTIEKAPVGSYTVQIWHEVYGIKTEKVTVKEGATSAIEVTYDAEKDRPAQAGAR